MKKGILITIMSASSKQTVTLSVDSFGSLADPISKEVGDVKRFTWTNRNGMTVQVILSRF